MGTAVERYPTEPEDDAGGERGPGSPLAGYGPAPRQPLGPQEPVGEEAGRAVGVPQRGLHVLGVERLDLVGDLVGLLGERGSDGLRSWISARRVGSRMVRSRWLIGVGYVAAALLLVGAYRLA